LSQRGRRRLPGREWKWIVRILMRSKKGERWSEVSSDAYEGETDLQALLAKTPGLIPVDEIGADIEPFVFAIREYGLPGSGSSDLVLFNPNGEVGIVECKLRANEQIKREVVGQILEYAAHLWRAPYDDVDATVRQRGGGSLSEELAKVCPPDWDSGAFRGGVEAALETGKFHLIIAVDEINPELKRIVDFLNESGATAFSFHALELEKYRHGEMEMLVPHLYGKVPARKQSEQRRLWTEAGFMEQASSRLAAGELALVKDLYDWAREEADAVFLGRGSQTASFTFHFREGQRAISVFSMYADGRMTVNYEYLSKAVDEERFQAFDVQLRRHPPFDKMPKKTTGFVSVAAKDIASVGGPAVEHLKKAVLTLKPKRE
jgi:hypothetical protein